MSSKKLTIYIREINGQKLVGFELKEITKDEAIVILNRCLHRLIHDYDCAIDVVDGKE